MRDLKDSVGNAENPQVEAEAMSGFVRAQVGKILTSKEFVHSDSLRRFLSYTVEKTLDGDPGCLKESLLGSMLFGRGDAFDPRLDPIVRVQAGKLRSRLQRYYEGEGRTDTLVIDFPKGGYVPVFHVRRNGDAAPSLRPRPSRVRTPWWAGAALIALAAVSLLVIWRKWPESPVPPSFTRLTFSTDSTSAFPSISHEGKLIVFASDRGGRGNLELFAQVIGGEGPVELTHSHSRNRQTDISPDGTRVVFESDRDGGGVYVLSLLSRMETKIASSGFNPRFSPDGSRIAYEGPHGRLYTVAAMGGLAQPVGSGTSPAGYPLWTPDGKGLIALVRTGETEFDWRVFPLDGGRALPTGAAAVFRRQQLGNASYPPIPGDWLGDRVVFSAGQKESSNLWELALSPKTFRVSGGAQRLTTGPGAHTYPRVGFLAPGRARVVFVNENIVAQISSFVPNSDQESPVLDRLTQDSSLVAGASPQISADGSKLAFCSTRLGNRDIWLKDLRTGAETAVAANPWPEEQPLISPNGLRVAYISEAGSSAAIQVWDAAGGATRRLCDDCGQPREWLPDNQRLVVAAEAPVRLQVWNALTGEKQILLPALNRPVTEAAVSPDGRWLAIRAPAAPPGCPETFIAPVEGQPGSTCKDWIALPELSSAWGLRWSQKGDLLYFFSSRDGTRCIWAQRLSPQHRPEGEPFAVQHFHRYQPIPRPDSGISIAAGRLTVWFQDSQSSIWMAEVH
ncbi:MAG TPA: hypothetical protein VEU11_00810 [Terriglobales bacterium]|nr:hypothetical protein [Terriglobales bacterium]